MEFPTLRKAIMILAKEKTHTWQAGKGIETTNLKAPRDGIPGIKNLAFTWRGWCHSKA
jgi:hypothetical protein